MRDLLRNFCEKADGNPVRDCAYEAEVTATPTSSSPKPKI